MMRVRLYMWRLFWQEINGRMLNHKLDGIIKELWGLLQIHSLIYEPQFNGFLNKVNNVRSLDS